MMPKVEVETRQFGDADSGVGEAQAGYRKEGVLRKARYQKEWARQLEGGGDEAGSLQT